MHQLFLANSKKKLFLNFFSNIFIQKKKPENKKLQEKLKSVLPFRPDNIAYYQEALTHKMKNLRDEDGNRINFERLEFLGDAIIETIISEYLFQELPLANEGELTVMRSKIVSRKHLNELGNSIKIVNLLEYNFSIKQLGNNISGNLYEALIGAIFLDKGYDGAKTFIYKNMIDPHIDLERLDKKISSYKSYMIEWAQKNHYNFEFIAHNDVNKGKKNYFKVDFILNKKTISHGRSTSKKKAEEIAARRAYYAIQPNKNGKN
jgi:ribonuclease-3